MKKRNTWVVALLVTMALTTACEPVERGSHDPCRPNGCTVEPRPTSERTGE